MIFYFADLFRSFCRSKSTLVLGFKTALVFALSVFFFVSFPIQAQDRKVLRSGERLGLETTSEKVYIEVEAELKAPHLTAGRHLDDIAIALFGLNPSQIIAGDEWTIFYGNLNSPSKEVEIIERTFDSSTGKYRTQFVVNLDHMPKEISQLTLALSTSLEGAEEDPRVGDLKDITVDLKIGNKKLTRFSPELGDLSQEKAIYLLSIYKHQQGWKLRAQGDGFSGGFAALFASLGGERSDNDVAGLEEKAADKKSEPEKGVIQRDEAKPNEDWAQVRDRITLEKIEKKAPSLIDLTKKTIDILRKKT